MKIIYNIILAIFLTIGVASADFSDDFSDGTITDWTVLGGTWNVQGTDFRLTPTSATAGTAISHPIASGQRYFRFIVVNGAANTGEITWTGAGGKGFIFASGGPDVILLGQGFTMTNVNLGSMTSDYESTIIAEIVNFDTQLAITVLNTSTGNVISSQQVAYTYVESSQIYIQNGVAGIGMKYNSIETASSSPVSETESIISFDADQYFVSDLGTISWTMKNLDWSDIFYYKTIVLSWTDGEGKNHETRLIGSPSQVGTYVYQFDSVGNYIVTLQRSFLGLGTPTEISSDTAIVRPLSQSYINTNLTAFMRVPFGVSYSIGYSLSGYTSEIEIIGTNADTGGIIEVSIIDASLGNTGTQIMQQTGVKVWPTGRYTLKLYDARKDLVLDTKYITIVSDPRLIPVLLFNTSNISTDRLTYFINDYMYIDFTVNDTSFRNYSIRADVYNYDLQTTTKQFFNAFTDQAGSFETLVNSKINMQCERGVYCWFESGNNTIRLTAYNNTYSTTIASYNFTVTQTTVDGWGLSLSNQTITTSQELTIKAIVPAGATGKLRIRDAGYNTSSAVVYFVENINEGTQVYKTTITRVNANGKGYYEVEIIDESNGKVKMHLPLTVTRGTGDTGITTPGGGQVGTDTALTLINVFGFISFWGFIIWLGIVGTIIATMANSQSGVNGMAVVVVAWLSAVFIALIGLFDPFKIYIIVLSTIIAAVLFKYGKSATTEG